MKDPLAQASILHADYATKPLEEKIHAGNILAEAARILLHISAPDLSWQVAQDLLAHAEEMAYTKQYDLSPHIKEYTYLAHALAKKASGRGEDVRLEPFAKAVAYYEA